MVYACSDLHGNYFGFTKLLKKINFSSSDHMYILGDVIDRGPEPVRLLMEILLTPNMTLLAGNHEYMLYHTATTGDGLSLWLENGGVSTMNQLSQISKDTRSYLIDRISELPLIIPSLEVNGRKFYLAHSSPLGWYTDSSISLSDASDKDRIDVLWDRCFDTEANLKDAIGHKWDERYRDRRLLIGHTPTNFCSYGRETSTGRPLISCGYGGKLINLDCGCSEGFNPCVLRLDDLREFVI